MRAKRVDALIASEPSLSRLLEDGCARCRAGAFGAADSGRRMRGPRPPRTVIGTAAASLRVEEVASEFLRSRALLSGP